MATVKASNMTDLAYQLTGTLVGDEYIDTIYDEEGNPIGEQTIFSGGFTSDIADTAGDIFEFTDAVNNGEIEPISATATTLTFKNSGSNDYEDEFFTGSPINIRSTYSETNTTKGSGFIAAADPNSDTFVSSISIAGSSKSVKLNESNQPTSTILSSETHSAKYDVFYTPSNFDFGMGMFSSSQTYSGFYTNNNTKYTYTESESYKGDTYITANGHYVDSTIKSFTDNSSAAGGDITYAEKFSLTSVDGFNITNDFSFSGDINTLSFSATVSGTEGNYSASYSSATVNSELAQALQDYANGDATIDAIEAALMFGNDVVTGTALNVSDEEAGYDYLRGFNGNDKIDGLTGDDTLIGGSGNDTLIGGAGVDELMGDAGKDSLSGGLGNDYLEGGEGNDILNGGESNDTLVGGLGIDSLTGGLGNDSFLFSTGDSSAKATQMDRITDFKTGVDTIIIDGIVIDDSFDLVVGGKSLNYGQALAKAFSSFTGNEVEGNPNPTEAFYSYDSLNGYLFLDSNADGLVDISITLVGLNSGTKFSLNDFASDSVGLDIFS